MSGNVLKRTSPSQTKTKRENKNSNKEPSPPKKYTVFVSSNNTHAPGFDLMTRRTPKRPDRRREVCEQVCMEFEREVTQMSEEPLGVLRHESGKAKGGSHVSGSGSLVIFLAFLVGVAVVCFLVPGHPVPDFSPDS